MNFQFNDKIDNNVLEIVFPNEFKVLGTKPASKHQLGPLISRYILPKNILKKMNSISESILKSDDKVRYGNHLAGQIDSEYLIPDEILVKNKVKDYFKNIILCYIRDYYERLGTDNALVHVVNTKVDISKMWIVEQFKHEYNPLHWHEDCTLSAVMYLKVPEMYNNKIIPGKANKAGNISFVNRSSNPSQSFESPFLTVLPKEGDIYIFPGYLAHTVYPFDNDVRRLSVSYNANH